MFFFTFHPFCLLHRRRPRKTSESDDPDERRRKFLERNRYEKNVWELSRKIIPLWHNFLAEFLIPHCPFLWKWQIRLNGLRVGIMNFSYA